MNKSSLLLATLLTSVALTSQAGELYTPTQYQDPASPSTLTRAEVRQSVLQARKAGALAHTDVDLPTFAGPEFGATRSAVKADVLAARAAGGLEHDDVDLPTIAKGSVRTRQEVRDEVLATRHQSRNAPGRNTIAY
jgi:Domain of unknown function (DUF4148)